METDRRVDSRISGQVTEALQSVLEYLWDDELAHYRSNVEEGRGQGHIFQSLVVVDQWLNNHRRPPEDFLREPGPVHTTKPQDGREQLTEEQLADLESPQCQEDFRQAYRLQQARRSCPGVARMEQSTEFA